MAVAFERAVFNVAFNNRDDHPKNFAYIMSQDGQWRLSTAYDVTFCEGPSGYHQMDVMGEALSISRTQMLRLAEEAEVPPDAAGRMIDGICDVASRFATIPQQLPPIIPKHAPGYAPGSLILWKWMELHGFVERQK